MNRLLLLCVLVLSGVLLTVRAQPLAEGFIPGTQTLVTSEPIGELSGLVKSPRRDNLFWAHNDSGNQARIFALDAQGKSVLPTYSKFTSYGEDPEDGKTQWQGFEVLYANNVDWEDIAADAVYLYLSDMGNNGNGRQDLGIYAVSEIDPTASTRSAVVQHYRVVYPDQTEFPDPSWNFDSESLFTADGSLYLITKHRGSELPHSFEPGAKLYRLDTRFTDQDNVLTLVDSLGALTAATGADLSPKGQLLAVVSYKDLWLFDRPADGSDKWLSSTAHRISLNRTAFKQVEAVTWADDQTLLLGNEQRDLFTVTLSELGL